MALLQEGKYYGDTEGFEMAFSIHVSCASLILRMAIQKVVSQYLELAPASLTSLIPSSDSLFRLRRLLFKQFTRVYGFFG